jgi:hypothetical protein
MGHGPSPRRQRPHPGATHDTFPQNKRVRLTLRDGTLVYGRFVRSLGGGRTMVLRQPDGSLRKVPQADIRVAQIDRPDLSSRQGPCGLVEKS